MSFVLHKKNFEWKDIFSMSAIDKKLFESHFLNNSKYYLLGVVNVPQDGLESLLEVAEDLQVKGLTQENDKKIEAKNLPRAPPAKKFKPARRPSDSFEKSEELPEEKPIKKEVHYI